MISETIERLVAAHGDMLFRYCLLMLGNAADAEDAVQETYLRYLRKKPVLTDPEHEKAWLLKVAASRCRDILRYRKRHRAADIDEVCLYAPECRNPRILEALMNVPEKYRSAMILHYIDGFSVHEIAGMIGRTDSAVKMRLKKGREMLKEAYRKEEE